MDAERENSDDEDDPDYFDSLWTKAIGHEHFEHDDGDDGTEEKHARLWSMDSAESQRSAGKSQPLMFTFCNGICIELPRVRILSLPSL